MRSLTFGLCLLVAGLAPAADQAPLTLAQTIALPGVAGRIDHFDFDAPAQRLYCAALGNDTVEVIDLASGKVVHEISGLKEPQGVVVVPRAHALVIANGDDGSVDAYDTLSFKLLHVLHLGEDADNVRYDAEHNTVYVGYGSGGISAIDPATWSVSATIPLDGHPEAFDVEPGGPRIFVNVPGSTEIAVIDRKTLATVARWGLGTDNTGILSSMVGRAFANFPMALDAEHHRLFIGCRSPSHLVVFDTQAAAPVAHLEISGDVDDLFYDRAGKRILASCGDGFIDVISQTDQDHYVRTSRVVTRSGARTSFWDPAARRLYLAVPERHGHQAEIRVFTSAP